MSQTGEKISRHLLHANVDECAIFTVNSNEIGYGTVLEAAETYAQKAGEYSQEKPCVILSEDDFLTKTQTEIDTLRETSRLVILTHPDHLASFDLAHRRILGITPTIHLSS
jgi:hypothetical protein